MCFWKLERFFEKCASKSLHDLLHYKAFPFFYFNVPFFFILFLVREVYALVVNSCSDS